VLVAGLRAALVIAIPLVIPLFLALIGFPVARWLERRRVPAVVGRCC
jgi:predicted PurR-regulated permease PerM